MVCGQGSSLECGQGGSLEVARTLDGVLDLHESRLELWLTGWGLRRDEDRCGCGGRCMAFSVSNILTHASSVFQDLGCRRRELRLGLL